MGQPDDLLLITVGVLVAVRLIPPAVMAEAPEGEEGVALPVSGADSVIVVVLWAVTALLVVRVILCTHLPQLGQLLR
ncbi:MAG: hypothetical protein AB1609_12775 [Bacillota bacterium]